jgi:hypothetical protein
VTEVGDRLLWKYVAVLLIGAAALFAGREAWVEGVKFGCLPPDGAKPANGWMQSCASDRIGEIDHGVIWFGTEPSVQQAILAAQVLIFGDSRIEAALSRADGAQWFASRGLRFYLLAIGSGEESGWAQMLLAKLHPHPAVIVFNADPFFTGGLSAPAQAIVANPDKELQYTLESQSFMEHAARYCRYIPFLCGRTSSAYRDYADGHIFSVSPERFWFGKPPADRHEIRTPPPWVASLFDTYVQNARAVISTAGIDPKCIVFTSVPNSQQDGLLAEYLAAHVGGTAITPHVAGLYTSDASHLTTESARIWTPIFLSQLEPVLRRCIPSFQPEYPGSPQ